MTVNVPEPAKLGVCRPPPLVFLEESANWLVELMGFEALEQVGQHPIHWRELIGKTFTPLADELVHEACSPSDPAHMKEGLSQRWKVFQVLLSHECPT